MIATSTPSTPSTPSISSPPAEQRVVLENITWQTFETLLSEMGDNRGTRLTYDRGFLEIMSPLLDHEQFKRILEKFVDALAEELNIEILSAGSATLKRQDLERGSEPDSGFYIQNESLVKGKRKIDLPTDPPPDLVIEIDITSSSLDKSALYAALGVPEIWRYNGRILQFLQLQEGNYIASEYSRAFPLLPVAEVARFLEQSQTTGETTLLRSFRAWVQQQLEAGEFPPG